MFYWTIKKPGVYDVSRFPCYFDATESDGNHVYGIPCFEYPGLLKVYGSKTINIMLMNCTAKNSDNEL